MTPHGMRGVASRPDHRSTPIRARRRGACLRNELRDVAAVLATCEQKDWCCAKWALRLSRLPKASCTTPRGCGDSSDRRSGCPIGPGWRCRQSGRPIGSRLHCRHIVPQIRVALRFRSKGRNRKPYSYEGGSHKFGCRHDRSSLVRDREQRPFYTARHPEFLFNKGERMGRRSATREAADSDGARLPANLIRDRLQRVRRRRAHKTIANAVVRPGKPGGAAV